MSRLHTEAVSQATGQAAQLFSAVKGAVGMVPNAYVTIGSNSPLALEAFLSLDGVLARSSLNVKEIEVIKLAVSEVSGCDYCLAAHSTISKMKGLSREAILAVRHGQPSGDLRFDALATFARTLASTSGTAPAAVVETVKAAGFSDAQIVDTLLAITAITFTNLLNRVNDTAIDFPSAD